MTACSNGVGDGVKRVSGQTLSWLSSTPEICGARREQRKCTHVALFLLSPALQIASSSSDGTQLSQTRRGVRIERWAVGGKGHRSPTRCQLDGPRRPADRDLECADA